MKKWIVLFLMVVLTLALLTACGCEHDWVEADCDSPKTCRLCEETEGAPLGHSWLAATCAKAKTCEICGTVDGAALPHTWTDATCQAPKTCSVCSATEGEPLAHTWVDATCETAKTCEVCGQISGEPLGHLYTDDINCEEAKVCGTCGYSDGVIPGHNWVDATEDAPKTCTNCGATEGTALGAADLGVDYTYFHSTMEAALDIYNFSLSYWDTDDDGTIWYSLLDADGEEMEIYMYYEFAADGETVSSVAVYTESALVGQTAYWTGVVAGCAMVVTDPSLSTDELSALTEEVDFSEDGIDYYTIEKNNILHVMAVEESSGTILFFITPAE